MFVNNESCNLTNEQIKKIEEVKNAKFVCDTQLPTKNGNWSDIPVSIFYGNKEHPVSKSRYFGIFFDENNKIMITDGSSVVDSLISAVCSDDGEIIYSRYRHDYRISKDESVFIDGGRNYIRSNTSNVVNLTIKNGELKCYDEKENE